MVREDDERDHLSALSDAACGDKVERSRRSGSSLLFGASGSLLCSLLLLLNYFTPWPRLDLDLTLAGDGLPFF